MSKNEGRDLSCELMPLISYLTLIIFAYIFSLKIIRNYMET